MNAIEIVKDGIHLGDIGSNTKSCRVSRIFSCSRFLWTWNWSNFSKSPTFYIMDKKE